MKNREIKFRAWDISDKDKGAYMLGPYNLTDSIFNNKDIRSMILMQYTGLKDKNGKEIYKGDIVKNCNPKSMALHETADVNYHSGIGGFTIIFESIGQDKMLGLYSDLEIIGNIYENPELS